MAKAEPESQKNQRLDKWLWAARFYKTRSLAVEAINGGKVHANGPRAKPSRTIHPGDQKGRPSKRDRRHIIKFTRGD